MRPMLPRPARPVAPPYPPLICRAMEGRAVAERILMPGATGGIGAADPREGAVPVLVARDAARLGALAEEPAAPGLAAD